MNFVLIGMPGCGKSMLGGRLAYELNRDFFDTDSEVERVHNMKISDIFDRYGEDKFRLFEAEAVKSLCKRENAVIATGGGAVKNRINMDYAKNSGIVIFLNRPLEHILLDIETGHRPLLKDGKQRLTVLYNERIELYKKYCDIEVENSGTLNSTLNKLVKEARRYENSCNKRS